MLIYFIATWMLANLEISLPFCIRLLYLDVVPCSDDFTQNNLSLSHQSISATYHFTFLSRLVLIHHAFIWTSVCWSLLFILIPPILIKFSELLALYLQQPTLLTKHAVLFRPISTLFFWSNNVFPCAKLEHRACKGLRDDYYLYQ